MEDRKPYKRFEFKKALAPTKYDFGAHKYKGLMGIKDSYEEFKRNLLLKMFNAKQEGKIRRYTYLEKIYDKLTKKLYTKICKRYNELIFESICKGESRHLPYLGSLQLMKTQNPGFKTVDHKTTKETGIRTTYANDHTDNYYIKFIWRKFKSCSITIKRYSFIAVRRVKRTLAKRIFAKEIDIYSLRTIFKKKKV